MRFKNIFLSFAKTAGYYKNRFLFLKFNILKCALFSVFLVFCTSSSADALVTPHNIAREEDLSDTGVVVTEEQIKAKTISPYIYRYLGIVLPNALVVPAGSTPAFSVDRLAYSKCNFGVNKNCLINYVNNLPYPIEKISFIVDGGYTEVSHLNAQLSNGKHLNIWQRGSSQHQIHLSDGSIILKGYIDNELNFIPPWGNNYPLKNLQYNPYFSPSVITYYKRISPEGKVIWGNVYFVLTRGTVVDRMDEVLLTDALASMNEEFYSPFSDSFILASSITRVSHLSFGDLFVEVDLKTGELKGNHPNIRSAPINMVKDMYYQVLSEMVDRGEITAENTRLEANILGANYPHPAFHMTENELLTQHLQEKLIKQYFSAAIKGDKK